MYQLHEIQAVHLEITTKCNAACPMCLRKVLGGAPNPQLPLVELSLQEIQKIFSHDFIRQLRRIYMCGNYGDPAAAQDTLEAFMYFREMNPRVHLSMFTNGGLRHASWWEKLARIIHHCRFAIDGLEDTNHIYRRHTKWKKIMENVESYIKAGGHAEWDFIVFKHNEKQIEQAQDLAARMGFKKFHIKKTGRFFSNIKSQVKDAQEVRNAMGEWEYNLEPPLNPKYQNKALIHESALIDKYGSVDRYFDQTPIICKAAKEKSIFVSAEGLVFPCCWTANQLYPWYYAPKSSPMWKFLQRKLCSIDEIDARKNELSAIISSEWMQKHFMENWQKTSLQEGRLKVCAKTCGTEFDPFQEQFHE